MVIFLNISKDHIEENISNMLNSISHYSTEILVDNIDDTYILASIFSKYLKKGDIININGELGSGKTAFMQGIAKYFDIEEQISSPTFTIVNEYELKNNEKIFHFDVYRLNDSEEFLEVIGTDYFFDGICIIEWGNIIKDILPKNTINIQISKIENSENKRIFKIWR